MRNFGIPITIHILFEMIGSRCIIIINHVCSLLYLKKKSMCSSRHHKAEYQNSITAWCLTKILNGKVTLYVGMSHVQVTANKIYTDDNEFIYYRGILNKHGRERNIEDI